MGGLWHPKSILIPMRIAIDANILAQQLLFLNQILIKIFVLQWWVFAKHWGLTLDSAFCVGVHPLVEVVGLCSHRR